MRYIADHDLHIHSRLSLCSNDPAQTPEAILAYGEQNGFTTLCLTDHMWDAAVPGAEGHGFYEPQSYARICQAKPLPQGVNTRFLFGAEVDMHMTGRIGISRPVFDELDFVIIPTTHLHFPGLTLVGDEDAAARAKLWCSRFEAVLDSGLPLEKVGIAHLTCSLVYPKDPMAVLRLIPDSEYHRLFARAAEQGLGIELNFEAPAADDPDGALMLKPFLIAKEEGCKFYFGSDAHHPEGLAGAKANFERIIDLLELTEDDKLPFLRK